MQLPALACSRLPVGRASLLAALGRLEAEHGFVRAVAPGRELFLFFHEGRAWCAGVREGGAWGALSVSAFVAAADSFSEATAHHADLPLFLCAGVLFRKAPAAHLPAALVDAEALLKSLRALGKDAVLAVQRGDAWALAFCRSGEPVALYGAENLGGPAAGSVHDRLMELIYADPGSVTLDLYDEIRLPPAADAGQPLASLGAGLFEGVSWPCLTVLIGDRVVFRHRLDKRETLIGRGLEVDLALDNLSISRRHARASLVPRGVVDHLLLEDLGSENGLSIAGARVAEAELAPGAAIGIGKYTLVYGLQDDVASTRSSSRASPGAQREGPPGGPRVGPRRSASADIKTVTLVGRGAVLEHGGRRVPVASPVFTIGRAPDAHLRIRGIFVAAVHAVLQIDGDSYRIDHASGMRALKVNGAVTRRARLADGDELVIAGERIRFRLSAP